MKVIDGGVTAAKGFQAAAAAAGIKYKDRTDMALIYSEKPCKAAGTFTTNLVKAAPVKWDRAIVESKRKPQAVIVNSGIANACTGEEGMKYCEETAKEAACVLGVEAESVLVGSTGVIGMQLPMDRVKSGIKMLAEAKNSSKEKGTEAAKAIMTTDTKKKEAAVTFEIGGKTVTIGGMSKGSGMIHPNMCTMLAFLTTDAAITKKALQCALSEDVEDTYNMISVDGDTSTNDTVLLLANGMADNKKIKYGTKDDKIYGVLFDVSYLWEEYLATILLKQGFKHPNNKKEKGRIYLAKHNRLPRYPDFYREKDNFVIDAKYKREINRDDIHQMITYMYRLKGQNGIFIQPNNVVCPNDRYALLGYGIDDNAEIQTYFCYIPQTTNDYKQFVADMIVSENLLKSQFQHNK